VNQRPIELYQEAAKFANETIGPEHADKSYFQGVVTGKFAELLIQDCVDELLKWKSEPFPLDAESAARIIQEHFGVER
jgi:hypothetical protein